EVAADLSRGLPEAGDAAAGDVRAAMGHEAGLNLVGHVQLLLQPAALGCLPVELVVDYGNSGLLRDAGQDIQATPDERALTAGRPHDQGADETAACVEG